MFIELVVIWCRCMVGVVDKLLARIVVDDYAGYGSRLLGAHGLSILVDVYYKGGFKRILFDTGLSHQPLLYNLEALGVKPGSIDYIVLSHSHYDHTGGLKELVKRISREVVVIAHPELFKQSFILEPELVYAGPPFSQEEIIGFGGRWILSRDPLQIVPGVYTTGEIVVSERCSFEQEPTLEAYKIVDGEVVRDNFVDEIGLVVNTRGGLVVFLGCSHPGVVSMVRKACRVTGVDRVYTIIGGFHLVGVGDDRVRETIRELEELGVERVYSGHCTGFRAEALFIHEFKGFFDKLYSGKEIVFE